MKIHLLFLTISIAALNLYASTTQAKENVVILHGILRSSSHMKPLASFLASEDYNILNVNYPSTSHTLEELIDMTHNKIESHLANNNKTTHFIGYSMGGILIRGILTKYRYSKLGKVILLGTPNHGSEVANTLKNNPLYQFFYGQAGQELTTDSQSIPKLCGPPYYELGIIAGSFTIDPISSLIIPGNDDGKVSINSTKLDGMKDHIVVSTSHTFMPSNKEVHRQALHFLKHSRFVH